MSNMVVRTNVLALNSHRNLGMVGNQQARASQRLSSGFRINSAADDAAGLGISEKMRSQIRGLNQASRNAQDGISLIQTAEGAMSTINEMIARIRELVVQAANDTNAHDGQTAATWSQSDRTRIQGEIDQLMLEIDATVHRTQFNTRMLIDGSLSEPGTGGGPGATGPFTGPALEAFANPGFNGNLLSLGDFATGFTLADGASTASVVEALQGALNNLIENNVATIVTDGGVTTWLGTFTANSADLTAAGITTLEDLMDMTNQPDASTAAADHAAFNEARAALLGALNGVDLSNYVEGPTASSSISPLSTDIGSITGLVLNGNLLPTVGDLDVAEGFQFIGNNNADTLHAALQGALNNLIENNAGTTVTDGGVTTWLGTFTANSADLTAAGITVLADLMDMTNQPDASTDAADHAAFNEARAVLISALETAIATVVEADETTTTTPGDAADGLWFQVGANVKQGVNLQVKDVGVEALSRVGDGDTTVPQGFGFLDLFSGGANALTADEISNVAGRRILDVEQTNLNWPGAGADERGVMRAKGEDIQQFLTAIDFALSHATKERSNLGAMQNRLEFTIQNLDIASENLSASESRIRDADMAQEMMRLTQANVLQQAATAMLAQANQAPQSILQLLG